MNKDLISLIIETLQDLNGRQGMDIAVDLDSETPLFGQNGILDSVGLVTLVVAVEQAIEDAFGMSVNLADDKAISQRHSPYRTIGALATYAHRVIQGEI